MGKFTDIIKQYTTDLTNINNALKGLDGETASRFSEIPDKIRAIETGYRFQVTPYNEADSDYVTMDVRVYEDDINGKQLCYINDSWLQVRGVDYNIVTKSTTIYFKGTFMNCSNNKKYDIDDSYTFRPDEEWGLWLNVNPTAGTYWLESW